MENQTAIEWLRDKLLNPDVRLEIDTYDFIYKLIGQAKEIEKEQLCYFYVKGAEAEINNPYVTNIEFYKETFKSK